MADHNTGRFKIPALLLVVFSLMLPATAMAQSDLREAGSELQFRVIDRFPEGEREAVEIPTVAPSNPFYSIIGEVKNKNWSTAHRHFSNEELATPLENTPSKRFLAGYAALQAGQYEAALGYFESVGDELEVLSDYLALYTAQAALQSGEAHRATLAAAKVESDSRLYDEALLLLARALHESGESEDRERAVEVIELYLSRYSARGGAPGARLLLGEVLEELERPEDAARAYLNLRENHPIRNETTSAEERLRALSDGVSDELKARIESESEQQLVRKYRGLFDLHRSERVIAELPVHIDDLSRGSDERCESLFMVARSHTKMRTHGEGTPWYDRVLRECPNTSWEIRALYLGGRGRWNSNDREGAMEIFARIINEYSEHSFADDAMYFTGRILRSEDRHDEAEQILKEQVQRYPDGDMAKDAHWLLVRRMWDGEDFDGVVDYIDGLESTGEDDLYSRGRLHYFRARALESAEKMSQAGEGYVAVVRDYPKTYYALLAFNRLARLQGATDTGGVDICATAGPICDELLPSSRESESITVPRRLRNDVGFDRGLLLLSLGLTDLARAEFSSLRNRHAGVSSSLWALASLLDSAGAYPLSHDIARRHIDGWMNQYPTTSTRTKWEVAYPTPFKEEVTRYARQRNIDAALIYAIMREESGFNPRIESWANARGLLQLIEDTAGRMAQKEGLSPYTFELLFDPAVNVRLGSAYMDDLGERLNGHPALIMAGYNGGYGVVSRWLEESGELPLDLWIEDIPFGQTRNYTKRVLMSYWIYSYLYGDERVPSLGFELGE